MEKKCPKCESPMNKGFATISGNAKYMNWQCEVCEHTEMQCMGVLR